MNDESPLGTSLGRIYLWKSLLVQISEAARVNISPEYIFIVSRDRLEKVSF